jgi:hypothetical protein
MSLAARLFSSTRSNEYAINPPPIDKFWKHIRRRETRRLDQTNDQRTVLQGARIIAYDDRLGASREVCATASR